jgi:hypothetical protein
VALITAGATTQPVLHESQGVNWEKYLDLGLSAGLDYLVLKNTQLRPEKNTTAVIPAVTPANAQQVIGEAQNRQTFGAQLDTINVAGISGSQIALGLGVLIGAVVLVKVL